MHDTADRSAGQPLGKTGNRVAGKSENRRRFRIQREPAAPDASRPYCDNRKTNPIIRCCRPRMHPIGRVHPRYISFAVVQNCVSPERSVPPACSASACNARRPGTPGARPRPRRTTLLHSTDRGRSSSSYVPIPCSAPSPVSQLRPPLPLTAISDYTGNTTGYTPC